MSLTRCEHCGAQKELVDSELVLGEGRDPSGGRAPHYLRMATVCVNPDCPGNESDLAPVAEI